MGIIVLGVIAVSFASLLYVAKKNRVIVYKNPSDIFISLSPWIIYLVLGIIATKKHWIEDNNPYGAAHIIIILIAILVLLFIIYRSYQQNGSILLGIVIGIAKTLIAFTAFLYLIYLIAPADKNGEESTGKLISVGIFGLIITTLVNGNRVSKMKNEAIQTPEV